MSIVGLAGALPANLIVPVMDALPVGPPPPGDAAAPPAAGAAPAAVSVSFSPPPHAADRHSIPSSARLIVTPPVQGVQVRHRLGRSRARSRVRAAARARRAASPVRR